MSRKWVPLEPMRPAVQYDSPCVGRPMARSAMASFMVMNRGVQRRWWPMASLVLPALHCSIIASASTSELAMGFSM